MTEAKQAAKAPMLARVLRDYWTADGDEGRVRAGSVREVTAEEMIAGLEAGVLERVRNADS